MGNGALPVLAVALSSALVAAKAPILSYATVWAAILTLLFLGALVAACLAHRRKEQRLVRAAKALAAGNNAACAGLPHSQGCLGQLARALEEVAESLRSSEQARRQAEARLAQADEAERRHIATELHDGVGQQLAVSRIKLGVLRALTSSTPLAESLGEVCEILEDVIGKTRTLTFDLSSPVLHELGLGPALEQLVEHLREEHGIECDLEQHGDPQPLDEQTRGILFRAVRELLFNIVKHARARKATVSIRTQADTVQIAVADDGVGFAVSSGFAGRHSGDGFGLFSIHERLEFIGGSLRVESLPGRGTRVTLVAPLKQPERVL